MRNLYFQGDLLPRLNTNCVWGVRLHPGEKMEPRVCQPVDLVLASDAVKRLRQGYTASVWLDDAELAMNEYKRIIVVQAAYRLKGRNIK